ncbi:MAG: hypothetical protein BWX70_01829 [Verrucomicrobia bacterium ADurb.Bin070]|nr:MAG: hypothetical protein BWX70_01829 [Verrucomicrobia bacterium ADurb.Bin070]
MMWRLHMQYLGSRVAENRMPPSGSQTGSTSATPGAEVSCRKSIPATVIV